MTREKAYNRIDAIIAKYEIDDEYVTITSALDYDALRIARKALEQEPCKNAIGREDMLDAIGHGTTYTSEELQRIIKGLPPVNPQPKMDLSELKRRILMEVDGGTDDKMLRYCDVCDRISDSIDKYQAEREEE